MPLQVVFVRLVFIVPQGNHHISGYIEEEAKVFFELTPVRVAKSLALSYQIHALPHDEAYDVFMTLPAHTSIREDAGQPVLSRAMRPPADKPFS